MSTVSLTAVTPAYPFITERIRGSIYASSDIARTTPIQSQIDSVVNHPTKIWRFTGLPQNEYIFSLDIIDDVGVALDNITILDVTPSDLDASLGASKSDITRLEGMITSTFSGTVDSLTFDPGVPTTNTWFRANAGIGVYVHFLRAPVSPETTPQPIEVFENDGQVDFIFSTYSGLFKKNASVIDLTAVNDRISDIEDLVYYTPENIESVGHDIVAASPVTDLGTSCIFNYKVVTIINPSRVTSVDITGSAAGQLKIVHFRKTGTNTWTSIAKYTVNVSGAKERIYLDNVLTQRYDFFAEEAVGSVNPMYLNSVSGANYQTLTPDGSGNYIFVNSTFPAVESPNLTAIAISVNIEEIRTSVKDELVTAVSALDSANTEISKLNLSGDLTTFSQSIPHTKPHALMSKTVTASIVFTPNTSGAVKGFGTEVSLKTNGNSAFSVNFLGYDFTGDIVDNSENNKDYTLLFYLNPAGKYQVFSKKSLPPVAKNVYFSASSTGLTLGYPTIQGSTADDSFGHKGLDILFLDAGVDGILYSKKQDDTYQNSAIGFSLTNALTGVSTIIGVYLGGTGCNKLESGTNVNIGTVVNGEFFGVRRVGSVLTVVKSTDEVTWTTVGTFTATSSARLYLVCDIDSNYKLYAPKLILL